MTEITRCTLLQGSIPEAEVSMLRRRFLRYAGMSVLPGIGSFAQNRGNRLLLTDAELATIRDKAGARPEIRAAADRTLKAGPWSVTFARPEGQDLTSHEYFSEGPYWWPDPKNPNGPYIRRDGERNPDRFVRNHDDLGAMSTALLALGMGAYFLNDSQYAAHAAEVASTWFLDPKTRMNPNLEHGQAVRGHNNGRGTGIIDTVSLIYAVQGLTLIEAAGRLPAKMASGLRDWFKEYLQWMTHSDKGLDEKKSGNNHATWWAAQVAAYAGFIGDRATQDEIWKHCRTYMVPTEIRPDGSCPREEARTRSLSYSAFNLDAFAVVCRLAQVNGIDLWPGVMPAVDYLMPYVLHPETWRKQQITPFEKDRIVFPGLASTKAYSSLPRALNSPWVLLVDLIVKNR
jgi:hypothetical protein